MTMNPTNMDRVRELCFLIASEHDRHRFQSLVEQLNLVLDGEDAKNEREHRRTLDKK